MESRALGMKLKQLREEKRYTLKMLADITGLSIGFISQVERGQTDPSLASLKKLAAALGISLRDLFDNEQESVHILVKAGTGTRLPVNSAVTCELLAPAIEKQMEPMFKTISPGGDSGVVEPHTGDEFIWVKIGVLDVMLGSNSYSLGPGDSVYFHANQPHRWYNSSQELCVALCVNTPPSFS